jgi:hypothetical protein
MHRVLTLSLILPLITLPLVGPTGAETQENQRTVEYVFSGHLGLGLDGVPEAFSAAWCDDNIVALAIAAANFCGVPKDVTYHIEIHDYIAPSVRATIGCIHDGEYYSFHTFTDQTTTTLPDWCHTPLVEPPGTTRIMIYPHAQPFGINPTIGEIRVAY